MAMKRNSRYIVLFREKMVGANLHNGYIEAVSELWTELLVGFNGDPPLS
jgi:hypothetical protein